MSRGMTPAERDELMAKAAVAALRDEVFLLDDPALPARLRLTVLETSKYVPGFALRFLSVIKDRAISKPMGEYIITKILVRTLKDIVIPNIAHDPVVRKDVIRQAIIGCCIALESGTRGSLANAQNFVSAVRRRLSDNMNSYALLAADYAVSKDQDPARALSFAANSLAYYSYHRYQIASEGRKAHSQAWDAAFRLIADIIIEEISR